MVKIVWTELAIDDLRNIHDYISKESHAYANNLVEKLISRVDQIEQFPESGRIVPEYGKRSLRELIEGSYRIIYKIHRKYIGVVRIHHSARLLKMQK
ncbi:MAG: type II toxin-antitoxin system RelE/ParE family toxin [Bacteroidia bacterium]|nr:type II toxin-antitoxin system RelE/ParE family toxin [Bacteroidia bacterium]